jgi:hypothetical protein
MVLKLFIQSSYISIGRQFRHLGFTFLVGQMAEVLATDTYIESSLPVIDY